MLHRQRLQLKLKDPDALKSALEQMVRFENELYVSSNMGLRKKRIDTSYEDLNTYISGDFRQNCDMSYKPINQYHLLMTDVKMKLSGITILQKEKIWKRMVQVNHLVGKKCFVSFWM